MRDELLKLPMEQLVDIYNRHVRPKTPATSKTFSKREKVVDRLEAFVATKSPQAELLLREVGQQAIGALRAKIQMPPKTRADYYQDIQHMLEEALRVPEPGRGLLVHDALAIIEAHKFVVSHFRFPQGYDTSGHRRVIVAQVPEPRPEPPPPPPKPVEEVPLGPPPRSARVIRVAAEELLLKKLGIGADGRPAGMPYDNILAELKQEFPESSTSISCLRWYATKMRERGEMLPARPRKLKGA